MIRVKCCVLGVLCKGLGGCNDKGKVLSSIVLGWVLDVKG